MAGLAKRLLAILLCLLLLAHQQKAYGLKGIHLFFRRQGNKPRMLAERAVVSLHSKRYPAKRASSVDPNRVSDRRVRRGSDPIHNRCWCFGRYQKWIGCEALKRRTSATHQIKRCLFFCFIFMLSSFFFRLCSTVSLWITYVLINYSAVDIVVNKLLVKWCWGPALIKQSFCTMCQDIWTSVCSLTQFPTRNWGVYSTWPSLVNMNHYLSWLGT